MRVAVLGGGLQGVSAALELAARGVIVDLFDKNTVLLSQAGTRNEGKIHLGYVYAADSTFATARTMIGGAMAFGPALRRWIGADIDSVSVSTRFRYLVHKESMVGPDVVRRHFAKVAREVAMRTSRGRTDYFGVDLHAPVRELTAAECRRSFDGDAILTAFETQEVSVDPVEIARLLRDVVAATPWLRVYLSATIVSATWRESGVEIAFGAPSGAGCERYDHVINALWDGRLAIDRSIGLPAPVSHVYRCKYGIRIAAEGIARSVPSVTILLGPFGDIVNYRNGNYYISWYPACMRGISTTPTPEAWNLDPDPASAWDVARQSFAALSRLVPDLGVLPRGALDRATVRGGVIVARGESDIIDPGSGLHRRHEIGIESHGTYHSIDTGKYTMAPLFARVIADRICGPE